MFRFQHNEYFILLALLPVFVLLFVWYAIWKQKKLNRIGNVQLIKAQLSNVISGRGTLKFILTLSALLLIIVGCANLQKAGKPKDEKRKGIDVVIALDVSKSMLATDVSPSRLGRAQQLVERLMDKLPNDRIGLVVFAGRAYPQVPLTGDHSAVLMALQTIRPETIPMQGTVLSSAIDVSARSFSQLERKYKSLILISDGEDHDEGAVESAKKAAEEGVIIHTIGIGSPQGVQLMEPGTNTAKLDEEGKPVVTRLNEKELQDLAHASHGTYSTLGNADAVANTLAGELAEVEQRSYGHVAFTDYYSLFQFFLLPAFLLLIIERAIPGAKKPLKVRTV